MTGEQDWQVQAGQRVAAAADALLDRLEQAVRELDCITILRKEKVKTESGECVTEYTEKYPRRKGPVDRNGLKQLTSVLKELQDILLTDPALELREKEAKILRLEQELNQNTQSDGVTVMLAGEADGYAG